MRYSLAAFGAVLFLSALISATSYAQSLKLAPLEYQTSLTAGEKKRGFVDISNPNASTVRVVSSVQAFRQIDDQGSLTFYDDEQMRAGVKLDLDEFDLGPREAIRMYFELDGTKLPAGDVFGAIFFSTEPTVKTPGVGEAVRLGTLLSIQNGTGKPHKASITSLKTDWLQFSSDISGSYVVKNTGNPRTETGFYPQVRVSTKPLGEASDQKSSLVFAGRQRENEFSRKVFPFGLYKVSASYQGQGISKWVFVFTPLSMLIIAVLGILVCFAVRSKKRFGRVAKKSSKKS
jgi:hypothetical protein